MLTLLVVVLLLVILFGGGTYGYRTWGTPGIGGALGLVIVILLVLYLLGVFH